ncbi:site-specific integrase [Cupriavidus sp. SW-Y-13]|uniref:site-specific integrase n=1 Tax=Cupriavidus sp. SW-Y-13 TaxID=2653854 RepID=UPI0013656B46|nr:site-specific integrase [Cupriavidus sp. SW-Y-13]MWL87675.1 tyrosine-type recombinase/integrase [Cupriavidus sp. SW-Y-13]
MTTDPMKKAIGVYSRRGSNIWQWKIRAPKDLRHLYSSDWAENCSLGTPDLRQANLKATQLRADWLRTFDEQRATLAPLMVETVTPEMAQVIAQQVLHDVLEQSSVREDLRQRRAMFRTLYRLGMTEMQQIGERIGIGFNEATPGAGEAVHHYIHELATLNAPLALRPPAPTKEAIELIKPRRLRNVFDRWKESSDRKPDSIRATERALKAFETQAGNPTLADITRDMGDAFRAWLRQQGGASKTHHDKLTALKTLLNYAARDLEWLKKNPWEGLDIKHKTENKREPWTPEQVKALFNLPLFTQYELPKQQNAGKDAGYWIPLLGFFTGSRVGELCQLRASDVIERNGVPFISINEVGEGSTVKTDASIRNIPLHSELIRLGFLDYVRDVRKRGAERLWPALKLGEDKPGRPFSNWFGTYRKTSQVDVPDFHSIRHTVRSRMNRAKVPVATQDKITGHEVQGSVGTRVYTHLADDELQEAVEAIQYPELLLHRVYARG